MTWDGKTDYGWGLPHQRALTDAEQRELDRKLDEALDLDDDYDQDDDD